MSHPSAATHHSAGNAQHPRSVILHRMIQTRSPRFVASGHVFDGLLDAFIAGRLRTD